METESSEHEGILFSLLCVPLILLFSLSLPYKAPAFNSLFPICFCSFHSGVEAVIVDESFNVGSSVSAEVLKVGQRVHRWLKEPSNFDQADQFSKSVVSQLQWCIPASDRFKSVQSRRERMWGDYHQLHCSSAYTSAWKIFLGQNLGTQGHPIFWQRVGDAIFKMLVKRSFPVIRQEAAVEGIPTIKSPGNECSLVRCWLCAESSRKS